MNSLRPIWILFAWLYLFLYAFLYIVFSLLTFMRFNKTLLPYISHGWGRSILWLLGIELEVHNLEHIADQRARIITFNHQSALDILVIAAIAPPGTTVIAKQEIKKIPIVNIALALGNVTYIDRSNREKSVASLNQLSKRLANENLSLFIAPEGTRTRTGDFLPFKKGAFYVALNQQIPIYPLVLKGAFEAMPKGTIFPMRGKITVTCLPPIATDDWSSETLIGEMDKTKELMLTAYQTS